VRNEIENKKKKHKKYEIKESERENEQDVEVLEAENLKQFKVVGKNSEN
jgi:hypothetical protein